MNTYMRGKTLLDGEIIEQFPAIDAGGCKYQCYTNKIKTKKGAEYYRLFCAKTDKKCKPYVSVATTLQKQKEVAEYREQLRQRLRPLAIKKIQVWQSAGELRIYITIKDTLNSGRFQVEKGQCAPETLIEAQTVLYITGNVYEKPGAYKYLGGKCGGSRKYPVYAFPKKDLYARGIIERALGFQLDSEEMIKLHTIYV